MSEPAGDINTNFLLESFNQLDTFYVTNKRTLLNSEKCVCNRLQGASIFFWPAGFSTNYLFCIVMPAGFGWGRWSWLSLMDDFPSWGLTCDDRGAQLHRQLYWRCRGRSFSYGQMKMMFEYIKFIHPSIHFIYQLVLCRVVGVPR